MEGIMNLADLHDANAVDVAGLPVSVLATLQEEYAALQGRTKRIGAVLDKALESRYGGQNAPGTSHREEGGFDVKVTVPKTVSWDADRLNDMAGDDSLLEWMEWTPKVMEGRYNAAPDRIKEQLDAARTVKMGKVKVEFKRKED
jgi:hypothetical protein